MEIEWQSSKCSDERWLKIQEKIFRESCFSPGAQIWYRWCSSFRDDAKNQVTIEEKLNDLNLPFA